MCSCKSPAIGLLHHALVELTAKRMHKPNKGTWSGLHMVCKESCLNRPLVLPSVSWSMVPHHWRGRQLGKRAAPSLLTLQAAHGADANTFQLEGRSKLAKFGNVVEWRCDISAARSSVVRDLTSGRVHGAHQQPDGVLVASHVVVVLCVVCVEVQQVSWVGRLTEQRTPGGGVRHPRLRQSIHALHGSAVSVQRPVQRNLEQNLSMPAAVQIVLWKDSNPKGRADANCKRRLPGRCAAQTLWRCQTATTSCRPRPSSSRQAPVRTATADGRSLVTIGIGCSKDCAHIVRTQSLPAYQRCLAFCGIVQVSCAAPGPTCSQCTSRPPSSMRTTGHLVGGGPAAAAAEAGGCCCGEAACWDPSAKAAPEPFPDACPDAWGLPVLSQNRPCQAGGAAGCGGGAGCAWLPGV